MLLIVADSKKAWKPIIHFGQRWWRNKVAAKARFRSDCC